MTRIQLIIPPFLSQKLFVSTLFDDAPMVEHNNLVGITNRREPVGNDESGTPLHDSVHTFLYKLLGTGINAAGGLVENEHRWISNRSTSNGQQLSLTLAEIATISSEHRLVTVGKTTNEIIGSNEACGLHAFLISSIKLTITDIVEDGTRKEMCLLQHNAHTLTQ